MLVNEFRVRPVTRFNLTHYCTDGPGTGSVRSMGEFDTVEQAEEVGMALNCLVPGSMLTTLEGRTVGRYPTDLLAHAVGSAGPASPTYVIVGLHTFDVNNKAYFAESPEMALALKEKAEREHGTEFCIFSR
jgi:hypothetical protein